MKTGLSLAAMMMFAGSLAHAQTAQTQAQPQPQPQVQTTKAEETPVDAYRAMSVGLVSGIDVVVPLLAPNNWTGLTTQFGNQNAAGIVGFNANVRVVYSGIVLSAQLGFTFYDRLVSNAIIVPGLSVGYAIPLTGQLALTPAFHTVFLVSTASGSSAAIQMTGEVGLEYFFGKHGYIEPVIAMGNFQDTGGGTSGQANFIFGVGYRLGVVF